MKNNLMTAFCLGFCTLFASPATAATNPATTPASEVSVERSESKKLPDGSMLLGGKHFTVLVEGAGPDIILIPGLSTPRDVWDKMRAQLKERYRLHIIQIRGFGDDALTNADGSLFGAFVFELADYIDDEIIDQGAHKSGGAKPVIIGHSLGGLAAMTLAARHPEAVEKAMIIDSLPFFGLLFGPNTTVEMVKPQAAAMRDALVARSSAEADERTLQTMSATAAGRAQVAAWSRTADARVTAQFFYEVMTTDIRSELSKISAPMTMLYPFDARVMPAERVDALYQSAFANAKTVRLQRIDDSRHFIMLDQPEAFAAAVEAFLVE